MLNVCFFFLSLSTPQDEYSFGDITSTVVSSFAEDTSKSVKERPKIGLSSSTELEEALTKWDDLSEEHLKEGLEKLNQYVEQVSKEENKEANSKGK